MTVSPLSTELKLSSSLVKMEKALPQNPPAELPSSDYKNLVLEQTPSQAKDIGLGQILEAETSPRFERRVVWKIDWMCVFF